MKFECRSEPELEPAEEGSFEDNDAPQQGNVTSITEVRSAQTVEEVVRAYFDAIVMQPIPENLAVLVRRLG